MTTAVLESFACDKRPEYAPKLDHAPEGSGLIDPSAGSPSFVTELPGNAIKRTPAALESTKRYVRNLAFWLANRELKADI